MKVAERDELLGRLDERTESIIRELQDQNKYLNKQNGRIRKLEIGGASLVSLLLGMGILEWKDIINIFGG